MTTIYLILALGVYQILLLLIIFIIPCLILIPNRKFTNILDSAIDEKINKLNLKERISFSYKGAKISLKRVGSKLKIEPYTNRFSELLLRVFGFLLAMLIVLFILSSAATFLDSMGVGDKSYGNGYARSVSWVGFVQISIDRFIYIYLIIFYFFGKIIRKKVLNRLLNRKFRKEWNEFYTKYHSFKY